MNISKSTIIDGGERSQHALDAEPMPVPAWRLHTTT
jgi:hypothetical protein